MLTLMSLVAFPGDRTYWTSRPGRSGPYAGTTTILVIFLLTSFCPGTAASQEWCFQPICARFEGSDVIRILSPGRFEITYTKSEGFGAEIYDLQADPDKLYDLSGLQEENGILWVKVQELGGDPGVAYSANNATDLQLLESGGARVRASHSGKHTTAGIPGTPWNDLSYVQTFTVYATGEVYVDYALISSRDITLDHLFLIIKSTGEWGNYSQAAARDEAHCVGEFGLGSPSPYDGTSSSFAAISSNGTHYFADMLMAMYQGIYDGRYWNEGYENYDFRCGLFYNPLSTLPEGTTHIPILMRIARDMNDPASAKKYAAPFQNPDTAFDVLQGTKILDDPGDRDGDGFNEEDGTYVVRRQPSQEVEFILHGGPPRENPAFKVLDWSEASPQAIQVNGSLWEVGTQFHASTSGTDFVLQLLGEQAGNTHVRVVPEPRGLISLETSLTLLGFLDRRRRSRQMPSCPFERNRR